MDDEPVAAQGQEMERSKATPNPKAQTLKEDWRADPTGVVIWAAIMTAVTSASVFGILGCLIGRSL